MSVAGSAGHRYLVCSGCGREGAPAATSGAARAAGKAAGWARSYPRGVGEDFRCPDCRRDRRDSGSRSRLALSARIPADLIDRIAEAAAARGVSVNSAITEALTDKFLPATDPRRPHVHSCVACNARWDEGAGRG